MAVEYLSVTDVAKRLGISTAAVSAYKLPQPDATIGRTRGWLPETIDQWKRSAQDAASAEAGHANANTRPNKHENALPQLKSREGRCYMWRKIFQQDLNCWDFFSCEVFDDPLLGIAERPYRHIFRAFSSAASVPRPSVLRPSVPRPSVPRPQFRGLSFAQEIAAAVDGLLHGLLRVESP